MGRLPIPKNLLPLKPADFMVLAALQEGPSHGYALAQTMLLRSGGYIKIRPGDLYRVLYRLADQALIEAQEPDLAGGRRRACYHLTELGEQVLKSEATRLVALGTEVLERLEPKEAREVS